MPRDFFTPKKTRPSMSDIIPLPKEKKPASAPSFAKATEGKKAAAGKPAFAETAAAGKPEKPPQKKKWPLVLLLLITFLAGMGYVGLKILPRVEIKIFLKKYPIVFNETIEISKGFSFQVQNYATSTSIKLPAELFTASSSFSMSFPATGKQNIQKKSQGKIIIYNSYSSDAQNLVAGTRFLTPDNKIFHLIKNITVPGAKIQEGKIVASSIEAGVSADQPGAEYNIGPVAKFTIPGFKGSPKYEGFYAQSAQPMTGGFVGEVAIPTDKDIAAAKTKIRQVLEDNLKIVIFSRLPKEFKVLDGASEFKILREEVKKEVDENNNFSVFGEAQMKLIAFREKDLKDMLVNQLKPRLSPGDYEVVDFQIEYGVSRSDFEKGIMSFPVKGRITFQNKTDPESLRQQAKGKNEQELKTLVFSLPGLEKAQLSFWPIYVKTAPTNINKIKVVIQ